jgi:hypothetical protein
MSDTPLGGKEINFPEEMNELERMEIKEEQRTQ